MLYEGGAGLGGDSRSGNHFTHLHLVAFVANFKLAFKHAAGGYVGEGTN